MAHDLVLRGGTIIDGNGAPRTTGDVAIDGDQLTQVGGTAGAGKREIDVGGLVVAPGFVDPHTHYDAQICWDPMPTPSCFHGITTILMGNCGFTLAPCEPSGRERLMRMLVRVEGMSLSALEAGIDWCWQSFPEYLDHVERLQPGLNTGCLIGHSALRYFVLRDAAPERSSTAAEIERMRGLVREAMQAGALGFSTSQAPTHWTDGGKPVPSRSADDEEVLALGGVLGEFGRGILEITTKYLTDVSVSIELARRSGRPVTYLGTTNPASEAQLAAARGEGLRLVPQAGCRPALMDFKVTAGVVFDQLPCWKQVMQSAPGELSALFRDPEFRARFRSDLTAETTGYRLFRGNWSDVKIILTRDRSRSQLVGQSIADLAAETGSDPVDAFFDLALEDELETEFSYCLATDLARQPTLVDDRYMFGLSDAGAHLTLLADHAYTTYFLGRWVRERQLMPLERAIQKLSAEPASFLGLDRRGTLTPGNFADVVAFDPTRVIDEPARLTYDLPGGDPRLFCRSEGIELVCVNGSPMLERGELTGVRSGRLLRGG